MFDIKGILDPIVAIINKVVPDKTAAAAATAQLQTLTLQGELQAELTQLTAVTSAQSDVDKVEAASSNIFEAGWRPFVGWICGSALLYVAILEPMARFIATVIWKYTGNFPTIDTTLTMQVLLGMLGMGAMRSYDKMQAVAKTATTAAKTS